jgi:hypothetical protein
MKQLKQYVAAHAEEIFRRIALPSRQLFSILSDEDNSQAKDA